MKPESNPLSFLNIIAIHILMSYTINDEPTYCTVEDVEETLDLPSPDDPMGMFKFSDMSHPSYERVQKLILAAEDEIDRRMRRSWRVNYVKDHIATIQTYWHDENGVRMAYFQNGGDYIQLRKDILPWDPEQGDKLEIRTHSNQWRDISELRVDGTSPRDDYNINQWIDYEHGKIYIRTRLYQVKGNAARISYRYGSEDPVPAAINRLACLIVASQILTMDMYSIKMGLGGDVAGIKDQILSRWQDEMNRIYSSYQRSGSVYSILR